MSSHSNDVGPAIAIEDLSKTYGRTVRALVSVSLAIDIGGITGLIGPNGSGKSTLLRTLVGFERPTRGRVAVFGIDPRRRRSAALRHIGYVPQSAALYEGLTVGDHLAWAAGLRKGFDRTEAAKRLMELEIPLSRKGGDLSAGQRAQVALALALGVHADVLLLDEPLADIDPLARREFLSVLRRIAKSSGMTVLLASQIVADIDEVCDRIVILGHGKVLLHSAVASALSGHSALNGALAAADTVVGTFPDAAGEPTTLVRQASAEIGRRPTLEELVLGYLASARPGSGTEDQSL